MHAHANTHTHTHSCTLTNYAYIHEGSGQWFHCDSRLHRTTFLCQATPQKPAQNDTSHPEPARPTTAWTALSNPTSASEERSSSLAMMLTFWSLPTLDPLIWIAMKDSSFSFLFFLLLFYICLLYTSPSPRDFG